MRLPCPCGFFGFIRYFFVIKKPASFHMNRGHLFSEAPGICKGEEFMSTLIDFSIFPVGKDESVSPYVARVVRIIKDSGLQYKLGPMGTTMEGEWDELADVVTRCFKELKKDCARIYMSAKVDYRERGSNRMASKVKSVDELL
jgi:uncharacterized protein (TIGR00106 family)